ncbi:MAG: Uma2 family endonuclease [Planctomycetes bacterium]|nr:Uma2 family endonuclease [Planctomycetota bacterium]
MTAKRAVAEYELMDDLLIRLGGISPKRVLLKPTPGTATPKDVLRLYENHKRLFELVDGTLVEKGMGFSESSIAADLIQLLKNYSDAHGRLGIVVGEAGTLKLLKKLVRIPDVSFTRRDRLPGGKMPTEPIPDLAPDLCVEVISKANTRLEMERKLKEYFLAGVLLVWFVNPKRRTVRVYTSPDNMTERTVADTLDGGEVLPGFAVPVAELFAELPASPKTTKPKGKKKR